MSDYGKKEIARASADWFVMKMPPGISEDRKEWWREMIQDAIYCAILTYEGLREAGPKVIRLFCPRCARPLRVKEKYAGKLVCCPACGRAVRVEWGRN